MNLFQKTRSIKGSVLIFSLTILSFMLISALSIAAVSVSEKKSSLSTEKSSRSFQVADSGVEIILQKIYKGNYATLEDLADSFAPAGSVECNADGEIGTTLNSSSYNISFYNNSDVKLTGAICSEPLWRDQVVKLKSEGVSGNTTRAVEVAVEPEVKPGDFNRKAKVLTVGSTFSCVVLENGNVECWGRDDFQEYTASGPSAGAAHLENGLLYSCGLIANGNTVCGKNGAGGTETDYTVGADGRVVQLSGAQGHKCYVFETGNVRCEGLQSYSYTDGNAITVKTGGNDTIHASCVIKQNGNVICTKTNSPPQDPGGRKYDGSSIPAVAVEMGMGSTDYWGCALLQDGNVECWGDISAVPPSVNEVLLIDSFFNGSYVCALLKSGDVECWGSGTTSDYSGQDAAWLSVGSDFTCILKRDGSVHCWGDPSNNQTDGYDPSSNSNIKAVTVEVGADHACAVLENKDVVCWGSDGDNQSSPPSAVDGNAKLPE